MTPLDKVNLVTNEQPENTLALITLTSVGILNTPSVLLFKRLRPVQPLKAEEPIEVTVVGIVIFSILVKLAKAEEGISVSRVMTTFFKESGTEPKILAKLLVELTLLPTNGMVILTIESQPLKAPLPMDVTESETVTLFIKLKFWKAPLPMDKQAFGIINCPSTSLLNCLIAEQLLKA